VPNLAAGHGELQAGHHAAWPHHPAKFRQRGPRVGNVPQQVAERQRVEGTVGERQPLGLPRDHTDPVAEAGRGDVRHAAGEHLLGQVDTDHGTAGPADQLDRHTRRTCRDVKDEGPAAVATAHPVRDAVDRGASPLPVLIKRKEFG
jgi:hypothetical protein